MLGREHLRRWRKDNGHTLGSLAGRVKVVPSYISDIENGNRFPSLALAVRLSRATDIPVKDLVAPEVAKLLREVA